MIRDKNPWVYRKTNKEAAKEQAQEDNSEEKKKFIDYKVCCFLFSMNPMGFTVNPMGFTVNPMGLVINLWFSV